MLKLEAVRHGWAERAPEFKIDRPSGHEYYVFIHLWNPVNMILDGKELRTEPSACIIFDTDYPQHWKPLPGGVVHDWLHIEGDIPALLSDIGLEFNKIYYPRNPSFITKITEFIETEFFSEKEFSDRLINLKLEELLCLIKRNSIGESSSYTADSETLKKLKDIRRLLLDDLTQTPDINEMARRISVSRSRFYDLYKSAFGISPNKDIINARIERAKIYLSSGDYSVERTAELVGYKNTFHFIRQFKQLTDKTPGKYN